MKRRAITLIYPYYENPRMLTQQLLHLAGLPKARRELLHLIVVDDGSPDAPLGPEHLMAMRACDLASVRLFRIGVDVRWNWLACRNLGVAMASTVWVLMTDMDHQVPEPTLARIQEGRLSGRRIYRFSRVDAPNLTPYKPHPNSWLMTRDMFDKVGGYDERFSGFYGTDGMFRSRCEEAAREVVLLDEPLVRFPRDVVSDASTTRYLRKQPEDRDGLAKVRAQIAASGEPGPKRGLFPWSEVTG